MKYLITIIILTNFVTAYAQINFEKGYFVKEDGTRVDCNIRNPQSNKYPLTFKYKKPGSDNVLEAKIDNVREFGIYNSLKFIRAEVKIDRSSLKTRDLESDKNPELKSEVLFLKVLVEGKTNLYRYRYGDISKYFFKKEDGGIESLIYHKYVMKNIAVRENKKYLNQLWKANIKCPNDRVSDVENIAYNKSDLINHFVNYNQCIGANYKTFKGNQSKTKVNLNIRPRLNINRHHFNNLTSNFSQADLDPAIGFGLGIEAETILPINKGKWSIFIEPTIQNFQDEQTMPSKGNDEGELNVITDYTSLELPVGLRHYLFLNQHLKIFLDFSYVLDINLSGEFHVQRLDNPNLITEPLTARGNGNFSYAAGIKYKDKFIFSIKFHDSRNILSKYKFWESDYDSLNFIFGYTLF